MKYYVSIIAILICSSLAAQSEKEVSDPRNELSTDVTGILSKDYRLDFNHRFKKQLALTIGLRTRSEGAGMTVDTSESVGFLGGSRYVNDAIRFVDARVGARWYLGLMQDRGFWFETSALVSLTDWRTKEYDQARSESIYPDRYIEPKTSFGLESAVGYRYVFNNGISLSAHLTGRSLVLRSTLQPEGAAGELTDNGYFDFTLGGSLLTVGYVW